jgi:hypothetical protein
LPTQVEPARKPKPSGKALSGSLPEVASGLKESARLRIRYPDEARRRGTIAGPASTISAGCGSRDSAPPARCAASPTADSEEPFIFGLQAADVELNRKVLSEMAIFSPADFDAILEIAKQHVPVAPSVAA